jgi:hypothetical protein
MSRGIYQGIAGRGSVFAAALIGIVALLVG